MVTPSKVSSAARPVLAILINHHNSVTYDFLTALALNSSLLPNSSLTTFDLESSIKPEFHTSKMITGLAHVNLLVPPGTFDQAEAFYAGTLGMTRVAVPAMQKDTLAWYSILFYSLDPSSYFSLHLFSRSSSTVHPRISGHIEAKMQSAE